MGNTIDTASLGKELYNLCMSEEKNYAVRRLLGSLTNEDQRRQVVRYKDMTVSNSGG